MNKYFKTYLKLEGIAKQELGEIKYEGMTKCLIANELDNILSWEEYNNIQLTDEQQEELINIIYDFYMNTEEDYSIYTTTYAVVKVLAEYENYFDFVGDYETNFSKVYDKFIWKL